MMWASVDGTTAHDYDYGAQADGSGALSFTLVGDFIPATPALETVATTSRWLPSGAGRADQVIQRATAPGRIAIAMLERLVRPDLQGQPWEPANDFGDPSLCPDISGL